MKTNKKVLTGIIIALAIVATNLQHAINNYGIGNWGFGLEAIACDGGTGTHYNHCLLPGPDRHECGFEIWVVTLGSGQKVEYKIKKYETTCDSEESNSNSCLPIECDIKG